MEYSIKRNAVQCLRCDDVIKSVHRHDLRWCTCGSVAVDGGKSYLRRLGDFDDWSELSEFDDDTPRAGSHSRDF